METIKLFNAVIAKPSENTQAIVSKDGYIIMPDAVYAQDEIARYWEENKLNGNDLNKTFHKSWERVVKQTEEERLFHQIIHYISTYGTNFSVDAYIPNEILNVPDVKIIFKVFRGYTKQEMTEKCLNLLRSGVALTGETIDDLLLILTDTIGYVFTGDEGIRNREAIVKIADIYGILPKDTMEFFRYIIYRATGDSLIIKNKESVYKIKSSSFNPAPLFRIFGLEKLAEIFNRFKCLFLAMKKHCPKIINKISRLSKHHHKPLVSNPLNLVTSIELSRKDTHWLDNASPYALFKALLALRNRINGAKKFVYRIRNGKTWTTRSSKYPNIDVCVKNYELIIMYCKKKFAYLSDKKFFLPKNVEFALPISEKMFVGGIPTGTSFSHESLAVGVYWKNEWGARDIDISGVDSNLNKFGWNGSYKKKEEVIYSGDITDAPNGAMEYMHFKGSLSEPVVVHLNIFRTYGEISELNSSGYKIIVAKGNEHLNEQYMMDPNNLLVEVKTQAVQREMIIGIVIFGNNPRFVLLNFGSGSRRISSGDPSAIEALYQQWINPLSFRDFIKEVGGKIVDEPKDADYDLSLETLEKDTFIEIFK